MVVREAFSANCPAPFAYHPVVNTALRLSVAVLAFIALWFLAGWMGITGSAQRLVVAAVLELPTAYFLRRRPAADDV